MDKLQGESYTALSVMPAGDRIGVNINLDDLFDRMNSGSFYESVLHHALEQKPASLDELLKLLQENGCEVSKRGITLLCRCKGLIVLIFQARRGKMYCVGIET